MGTLKVRQAQDRATSTDHAIKFITIDAEVLYRTDLGDKEKLLLALIQGFHKKGGSLYMSNAEIGRALCTRGDHVTRLLRALLAKKLILITNPQGKCRKIYSNPGGKNDPSNIGPQAEVDPPNIPSNIGPQAEVDPPNIPSNIGPQAEVDPPNVPTNIGPQAEVDPPNVPSNIGPQAGVTPPSLGPQAGVDPSNLGPQAEQKRSEAKEKKKSNINRSRDSQSGVFRIASPATNKVKFAADNLKFYDFVTHDVFCANRKADQTAIRKIANHLQALAENGEPDAFKKAYRVAQECATNKNVKKPIAVFVSEMKTDFGYLPG